MSLRDQLRQAVACCAPIDAQHATPAANDATVNATPAQQPCRNLREVWVRSATTAATHAQQAPELGATSTKKEGAPSCVTVASELTAHRTMKQLLQAAMRACDHWNDSDEAREEMRRQCLETPPHLRADLLEHFNRQYPG